MTDYSRLPVHMQKTARLYVEKGIPGGSFFTAVASNDLMGAFGKADEDNRDAMWEWCNFFYNEVPMECHGSPEIVRAWIERGGVEGRGVAA